MDDAGKKRKIVRKKGVFLASGSQKLLFLHFSLFFFIFDIDKLFFMVYITPERLRRCRFSRRMNLWS